MQAANLGQITVAIPGTPVQASANTALVAAKIRFHAPIANTNPVYVGVAGLIKATLVGVIDELAAGQYRDIDSRDGTNALRLSDYWADVATGGEGVVVSYWVR